MVGKVSSLGHCSDGKFLTATHRFFLHSSSSQLNQSVSFTVNSSSIFNPLLLNGVPSRTQSRLCMLDLGFQSPYNSLFLNQSRHFSSKERKRKPGTPETSKLKKTKMKFYSSFKMRFRPMHDGQIRRWRSGKRHNAHLKETTTETLFGTMDRTLRLLEMGFSENEISSAMDKYGSEISTGELADSIFAKRIGDTCSEKDKEISDNWTYPTDDRPKRSYEPLDNEASCSNPNLDSKEMDFNDILKGKRPKHEYEDYGAIAPEFVHTQFFSALIRKEGYVHNLSTDNRSPILPRPSMTIEDALPHTKPWWPSWDTRKQLSCICSDTRGTFQICDRLGKILANSKGMISKEQQAEILHNYKTLNLVWVDEYKLKPIEPEQIETILGYPRNHTF